MPQPSLPNTIPIGIPSELAQQRPDVLSAQAKLHKATADIGVAQANFYPRITLVGRTGFESFESGDLATWDASFLVCGPCHLLAYFSGWEARTTLKAN